jgi:hypothetical protein
MGYYIVVAMEMLFMDFGPCEIIFMTMCVYFLDVTVIVSRLIAVRQESRKPARPVVPTELSQYLPAVVDISSLNDIPIDP